MLLAIIQLTPSSIHIDARRNVGVNLSQSNSYQRNPIAQEDDTRSIIARGNPRPWVSMTKNRWDCRHGVKCFDRRRDTTLLLNSSPRGGSMVQKRWIWHYTVYYISSFHGNTVIFIFNFRLNNLDDFVYLL